jgi:2-dehydro-3-deoxyphosphogluconate aldolase/(4S)-4-hydroxy-2-oxoglutarate aldolase
MQKEDVIRHIRESGLVAVVRAETAEKAKAVVEKCLEGGVNVVEITFTVPYAHRVIEEVSRAYGGSILLGAGTVLDSETARIAMLSGAQFIVSPHFNAEIIKTCNRYRTLSMAGILTINEAVTAMEAGADILKLFPSDLFGPAFIKNILGPIPYAQIIPTGGINPENTGAYIKAGAIAVGAGSSLTNGNIKDNMKAFQAAIRQARGEK